MWKLQALVSLCLSVDEVPLPECGGWQDRSAGRVTGAHWREGQRLPGLLGSAPAPCGEQILWLGVNSGNHLSETQFPCLKPRCFLGLHLPKCRLYNN